jgi:uncharacterized protein (DUF1330 family)
MIDGAVIITDALDPPPPTLRPNRLRARLRDEPRGCPVRQPGGRSMVAYVIVEVEVTDPVRYEEYRKLAPAAISRYGGRYVVRGGKSVTLEGGWAPKRVVVLEFKDLATAQAFYDSPEYRAAREVRAGAANMRMVAVEGV